MESGKLIILAGAVALSGVALYFYTRKAEEKIAPE